MSFETEIIENIKSFKDKIAELCDNYSETSSTADDDSSVATPPQKLTVKVENIEPNSITVNIEQSIIDRARHSKKVLMKRFDKILRKQEKLAVTNRTKCSGLFGFFEHICEHKKRYFATGLSVLEAVYIIATTIKRYT